MKKLKSAICWEGDKVKGSRFVAHLTPLLSRSDASKNLTLLRERYFKATHVCFAWRLSDGSFLCSDDGEPKGSAGLPILRHLEGAELVDVLGVVVRFYGGTKLGVGGLIRAYGGALSQALKIADVAEFIPKKQINIEVLYPDYQKLISLCQRHRIDILSIEFEARVRLKVCVPLRGLEAFLEETKNTACGRITCLLED